MAKIQYGSKEKVCFQVLYISGFSRKLNLDLKVNFRAGDRLMRGRRWLKKARQKILLTKENCDQKC